MAHMHTNLMCAARKQMALDERIAVVKTRGIEALEDLKGRNGLARERVVRNRHLDTVARRTRNAGVNGALIHSDMTVNERDITTIERTRADEILERALGVVVLCRKHETRGIAIQTMHDAGAVLALHGAQMVDTAVIDQGIRERTALMTMCRMAHQAALLGEHDKVVVLIANVERDGLGNHIGGIVQLGQIDRNTIAGAHGILFGQAGLAIDGNGASLDQMRAGRARGAAVVGAQIGIKALTSGIVGNKNMDVGH